MRGLFKKPYKISGKLVQMTTGVAAALMQLAAVGFVYWLIKRDLGSESLGLWALIFSYASVINLSGFGIGQTMVHFSHSDEVQSSSLERHFRVATTITLVGSLIFGGIIFFPARAIVLGVVTALDTSLINGLLVIILTSFCTTMLYRVVTFTLTGLGFFWVGQLAIFVGAVAYCIVTFKFLPDIGLVAAAYGHLAMSLVTLFLSWLGLLVVRLKQANSYGVLMPIGVYRKEFKAMISLGISFQVTSFLFLFLEPVARTTLAHAGGLSLLGYYEMANRLVLAPRELIARPAAFLSGQFAEQNRTDLKRLKSNFNRSLKQFWLLGLGMLVFIAIIALPAADYWVQERNAYFFFCVAALGLGWSFSVPALIPWNCGVGLGINQFNLNSVFLMVLISSIICLLAYFFQHAELVPLGVACAVALAEIYLIFRFSVLLNRNKSIFILRKVRF